jgi:hypothetical protein
LQELHFSRLCFVLSVKCPKNKHPPEPVWQDKVERSNHHEEKNEVEGVEEH